MENKNNKSPSLIFELMGAVMFALRGETGPAHTVTHLRPGQAVIEVVFHLVVFRETQQVTVLHIHKVLRLE